ncbi:MAG: Ig-like domain-containing protein [Planctomycetes bacterium]|nr:Ig-like domain-containing protein [Planctomycetota bacterium]
MTRPRALRPRPRRLALPLALVAAAAATLPGCDNPACIYGPAGCQAGGGSASAATASTFPVHGESIDSAAPRVLDMYPGTSAGPDSPLVIVFSETIAPGSISQAFELRDTSGLGVGAQPLTSSVLIGDGRVLVIFPPVLVAGNEYELAWADGAGVRDLTGSLALRPTDGVVGTFTVEDEAAAGTAPRVVMTWPEDGATGVSPITEVVTVFDRAVDQTTVLPTSWRVRVGGAAPAFDPLPQALTISVGEFPPTQITDTRVWSWKSVDPASDLPVNLGTEATVTLELSPADGTRIETADDVAVATQTHTFTTARFAPPMLATVLTEPTDALGVENLEGATGVMVQVDLEAPALAGDVLEIWLFGTQPGVPTTDEPNPPGVVRSFVRTFALDEGTAGVVLQREDLDLLDDAVPPAPLFVDGDVGVAFALRSGGATSTLRVLDVDLATAGIQDLLQDTVPPTFLGLGGVPDGALEFRSEARDLVVLGSSDEEPRSVEVVATLSGGAVDNRVGGQLPPIAAFTEDGDFVAAPVPLGTVDAAELPVPFSVVVYDRALNASAPFLATWTQLGATGPATALPGSGLDVDVTVYDAVTLEPVAGAVVYAHEVDAGALTVFAPQPVITDADGRASIASAPVGATLLTVEKSGYRLFSFQDVATTRLDVPLAPQGVPAGLVNLVTLTPGSQLSASFLQSWVADSRALLPGETVGGPGVSTYDGLFDQTTTNFTPQGIRAGVLGALTFLTTKQPASQTDPNAFSAASFLQAFDMSVPRPAVSAGGQDNVGLQLETLLSGVEVAPEDVPLGVAGHLLLKPGDYGIAFPAPDGDPRVSVEVLVHGLPGAMTVGLGKAYFDSLQNRWDLRAAYSALARAAGPLVDDQLIADERYLRVELVDTGGGRSGVRRALTGSNGLLQPPNQPLLAAPGATATGKSYAVTYDDVIGGAIDGQGLVRVLLVDQNGRGWELWQPDPLGVGGTASVFLPPIELAGGTALADGMVSCVLSGWAWPGFDAADLLFSDVPRLHDEFFTTPSVTWTQVP